MASIDDRNGIEPTSNPEVEEFDGSTPVVDKMPLDLLQKMAVIAHRSLERRPPKLKLKETKQNGLDLIGVDAAQMKPILSQETSEIAYQIVMLVLKLQEEVEASDDLGARKGLLAVERVSRMFEHIYQAKTTSQAGI